MNKDRTKARQNTMDANRNGGYIVKGGVIQEIVFRLVGNNKERERNNTPIG